MEINLWEIMKDTLPFLWKLWPVWLVFLAIATMHLLFDHFDSKIDDWHKQRKFRKGEAWRSDRQLLQWLQRMKPLEFEDYISDLFSRLGYKAQAVGQSHDGGIDVVAEKDGIINYIQCKKFITSEVAVGDVRNFYGSLVDHLANGKGYFITTNKFTLEAQKFAEDKPIELIDSFRLIEYINMANKNKEIRPITSQTCPQCGGKLVEKTGKYGKFFGCSNYPKCRYTKS